MQEPLHSKGVAIRMMVVLVALMLCAGCGVANIASRGEYIDNSSIAAGTPRKAVLARFGAPLQTKTMPDGHRIDTFRVVQGEGTGSKVVKAGSLLLVDLLTLGISEAVATPVTDQKEYVLFEVTYDKHDQVQSVRFLDTAGKVAEAQKSVDASAQ